MIEFLRRLFESQYQREVRENLSGNRYTKNLSVGLAPAKKIKCNCKREEDVKIVNAIHSDGGELFEKYLNKEGFEFKSFNAEHFRIKIEDTVIKISYGLGIFAKSACLSCGTCLGWNHQIFHAYAYEGIKMKEEKESPEDYFSKIIRKHVVAEKKCMNEKELALKICGESDEIV